MKTEDLAQPDTPQMSTTRRIVETSAVYMISCYGALHLMTLVLGERKPDETNYYFFLRFMLIGSVTLLGQFVYKRLRGV